MSMLDLAVFYDPGNWTRRFWEYGSGYTIVPNRHIGLDIGTQGQAKRVPALLPGPIVSWVDTGNLGRIYIQDVRESGSEFNYLSYCHMSRYNPPQLGISLHQGEEFGRLATGPKSLGYGHANFPGTSWTGTHLHLVWHNKVRGAYTLNQNDRYGNPEDLIREILSTPAGTPGGYTPFDPTEEDDMPYTPDQIKQFVQEAIVGLQGADGNRNVLDSVKQTRDDVGAVKRSVDDAGGKVWRNPLVNPLTGLEMPAKDFLRYLPHHHRDIILEVRALNEDNLSKLSDSQLAAYEAAVLAEIARRKK